MPEGIDKKKIDAAPALSRVKALARQWAAAEKGRVADDYRPDMPAIDAQYLIGYLWEIGPTMAAGMGAAPLSHVEIAAWQANVGIELQPWETRLLRRLSYDYLAESRAAESADSPAPWTAVVEAAVLSSSARKLQSSIRALANL